MLQPSYISRVRKVKGNKIEIEVSTFKNTTRGSLVALLNKSDDRFSASKPRRGWLVGQPEDIKSNIPSIATVVDEVMAGAEGAYKGRDEKNEDANLGLAQLSDGTSLNVQIIEATAPITQYQKDNPGSGLKRRGAEGAIMTHGGNPIYSSVSIVAGEAKDVTLEADAVATTVASEIPSSLQNADVEQ